MLKLLNCCLITTLATCLLLLFLPHFSFAEDWPTFRGVGRDAVSSETNLLDVWGDDGPELVFAAQGAGRGYASPAVAEGKLYTLGDNPSVAADEDEYLTCFDAATGELLWMQKTGLAWMEGRSESWKGARGTPTVVGDMVFVITPFGKIVAAQTTDGEIVWTRDLREDFGGKKGDGWGYSESPLVDGDKVVCTPGGEQATVIALDKATGDVIWTCVRPGDRGAGHSSIVVSEVTGRKIYVQNTSIGPLGIDAETGEMLWEYVREKPTAFIPSPVVRDDLVFSVAGYGAGGALLQQVALDDEAVGVKEIYGPQTKLQNKHGGVVLVDGYIYGGSGDDSQIFCANLMTGDILWRSRGAGSGSTSVAAADGKLFLRFANGMVALAEADPSEYKETCSFKTPGSGSREQPSWSHPVIANGKLYLREGDKILCYDISQTAVVSS